MPPDEFLHSLHVSRETIEKLIIYRDLLFKWQRAVNLVSAKTLPEAWERHFVDSAQMLPYLPQNTGVLADLGSGAGFPGLVLAILNPGLEVHLVESDDKKCQFMRTVSRETQTPVKIHNDRIEKAYDLVRPDMITARALADLGSLFDLVVPWVGDKPDIQMLFLKGAGAADEIAQAQARYDFEYRLYPSVTHNEAAITHIRGLKIRN